MSVIETILVDASDVDKPDFRDYLFNREIATPTTAVADGVADDTEAIQDAIDSIAPTGGTVFLRRGDYLLSEGLDTSSCGVMRLKGELGTRIFCKDLDGYVFDVAGYDNKLILEDLEFDGRNGGLASSGATNSDTWRGVLTCAEPVGGYYNLFVRNVQAYGSNAEYAMWDLRYLFWYHFENCDFQHWPKDRVLDLGTAAFSSTTATFRKCYFHYCREIARIVKHYGVHFDDCVFEHSVVALAGYDSQIHITAPHFENIGFDVSEDGLTTGVSERAMGLGDFAGDVTSPITLRYGQCTINGGTFTAKLSGNQAIPWVDGIAKLNGLQYRGSLTLNDVKINEDGDRLVGTSTEREDFEYRLQLPSRRIHFIEDQRAAVGHFSIKFDDGTVRQVDSRDGHLEYAAAAVPAFAPDVSGWLAGDTIRNTSPTAGGNMGWVNASGGFKTFGAIAA